jgi:hypothetical protein
MMRRCRDTEGEGSVADVCSRDVCSYYGICYLGKVIQPHHEAPVFVPEEVDPVDTLSSKFNVSRSRKKKTQRKEDKAR